MDAVESSVVADGTHPAVGVAGVETGAVVTQQDRSLAALTDRQIDCASGAGTSGTPASLLPLPTICKVR
jgi:hypothetical protein